MTYNQVNIVMIQYRETHLSLEHTHTLSDKHLSSFLQREQSLKSVSVCNCLENRKHQLDEMKFVSQMLEL